jgi:molybdate transport system substrate-binding protein
MTALVAAAVLGLAVASARAEPVVLRVSAAASLAEALRTLVPDFARTQPGVRVETNVAGSPTLVHQLAEGAPADVLVTADEETMARAAAAHLLAGPARIVARNGLAIAVAPGNPRRIARLADLARPGLTLALCAPAVPCGRYAREAFARAGAAVPAGASEELRVTAALAKVVAGEADAAVVYRTDVQASAGRVTGIPVPPEHDVVARYPAAVVRDAAASVTARAFVAYLTGDAAQAALRRLGFLPP